MAMIRNIVIVLLIIACLAEGAYIVKIHHSSEESSGIHTVMRSSMSPTNNKRPPFLAAGMKFQDNPLFSKAYKIAPGTLSADAQKALTGWDVKQQTLVDGTIQVNLVPHESEDVQQEFMVKPGYSLYFIEMNLIDDTTQKDNNKQDDMGVLVDQNGLIVQ